MKKLNVFMIVSGILLCLCACGQPTSISNIAGVGSSTTVSSDGSGSSVDTNESETGGKPESEIGDKTAKSSSLSLICSLQESGTACATDKGCYYLSSDSQRLSDGRYATHLMYMDVAARQEIYLCNNAACAHNTVDCTSVLLAEDFPHYSTLLFVWDGNLYILSKAQDCDGSSEAGFSSVGAALAAIESTSTVLYRANLDGTGRNRVHTFDPTVTVEDFVVGDAGGLYFVTKKLTTQQENGSSYYTSSERKLIYLDLAAKTETEICSMDFGDNISWDVIGTSGRMLVLCGVDFGRHVSPEEMHDDDIKIYDDSYDVFATLDVDNCSLREIYRVYAPKSRSHAVHGDKLYFAVDGSGRIVNVDLYTGQEAVLCKITKNLIWGTIGDKLYCYDSSDCTYNFVDVNTGKISHSGLVNKTTGWGLNLIAEIGDQVLVNYDSDGTFSSDGSFHTTREHYGLIDKEDLYAGIDNFAPISMIGKGMR